MNTHGILTLFQALFEMLLLAGLCHYSFGGGWGQVHCRGLPGSLYLDFASG